MNINLPYEIGTILKRTELGKEHYDKVHHYIIGEKIQVVLELCTHTDPRLSMPIDITELQQKWSNCQSKKLKRFVMEKQLALQYISFIQQKALPYTIDEKKQPHFWEAVALLCEDNTKDITSMLQEDPYCIILSDSTLSKEYLSLSVNHYANYNAQSVKDLAYKIAEEITKWNALSIDDMKLMLYSLKNLT